MKLLITYMIRFFLVQVLLITVSCATTVNNLKGDTMIDVDGMMMPASELSSNEGEIFSPKPGETIDPKSYFNNPDVMTSDLILGYYAVEEKVTKEKDEEEK